MAAAGARLYTRPVRMRRGRQVAPIKSIALLDRRVQVIEGHPQRPDGEYRVSDLRSEPFVIFLGEPGIGKSIVLGQEASLENADVIKVRELINGVSPASRATLFLDALDEYRTDGQPADKAYGLARAISASAPERWRLSCRSEDWRKEADIAPIRRTTRGAPIVVAQLLPLNHSEAAEVLLALGETDSEQFLEKAAALGASGFTENPLSLRLLHTAVSGGGEWPRTRFELFEAAVRRLGYERDADRTRTVRHSIENIVATASEACLLLLASGAKAIWRSNDEPPASGDARAYLSAHDFQENHSLVRDTLDTALFRGEGEAFEPMHRTVAEYLGGKALALAVTGSGGRAALPLSRAIALITGNDGSPPTELRGLYAWFAAHLAKLGHHTGVLRLIEADAVTVLAYGDAAMFDTSARRAILTNLDRNDPYFRASEFGDTAVGGLSGDDLVEDFTAILSDRSDRTHRPLTVFEALASGPPVISLRPLLRTIVLDATRPEWHRLRAVEAWLNGAVDETQAQRELFDALAAEPVSTSRERLRSHIAALLPRDALGLADIKSLIADYDRCPPDDTIGRLFPLRRRLIDEPRPELFEEPSAAWRPPVIEQRHTTEVDNLIDHALAAAIRATPDLTGESLWRWIENSRSDPHADLEDEAAKAVAEWLNGNPTREGELFNAILDAGDPTGRPWMAEHRYMGTASRSPSPEIVRSVLARAASASGAPVAERLLRAAISLVHRRDAEPRVFWETYDCISRTPCFGALLEELICSPIDPRRVNGHQRSTEREERRAKTIADNLAVLTPVIAGLRAGAEIRHLDWAAQLYFRAKSDDSVELSGLDHVASFSDRSTADAAALGWIHLATVSIGVSAARLGGAEANNQRCYVEYPAIAGLDLLLAEERCPDAATMPIELAIAVLKSGGIATDEDQHAKLERWAIARLGVDHSEGAAALLDFWNAALDGGATELSSIWRLINNGVPGASFLEALERLLSTRPTMPPEALRSAIRAVAKHIDASRFQALAAAARSDLAVVGRQRAIWSFVAFNLDTEGEAERFISEHSIAEANTFFDEDLSDGFADAFSLSDRAAAFRDNVIIRMLGPAASLGPQDAKRRSVRIKDARDRVRTSVNTLSQNPSADRKNARSSGWHRRPDVSRRNGGDARFRSDA